MNILALDTSSRAASCAIMRDGVLAGDFFANIGLTHSQTSMAMVESLLAQTRMTLKDIDVFAVSVGPGSFTGLRIGISAVKGMALALDRPCASVPTLTALAANAALFAGYIAPVMDARRGQVYTALFQSDGGNMHQIIVDDAISLTELEERLRPLDGPVVLVGDGAGMCGEALGHLAHVWPAPERFWHQRAASVAAVAAKMVEQNLLVTADALAPAYLRLPQAERERMEREKSKP